MWVAGRKFGIPSFIPVNSRHARFLGLGLVTLVALLVLRHLYNAQTETTDRFSEADSLFEIPRHVFGRPSDFRMPSKTSVSYTYFEIYALYVWLILLTDNILLIFLQDWFDLNCYPEGSHLGLSIADVYRKLELMKASEFPECSQIWFLFNSMFSMELIEAGLKLPEGFQSEVKGWLGNDPELFEQVHHQVSWSWCKILTKLLISDWFTFIENL